MRKAASMSEISAEATNNMSAELISNSLPLYEQNIALNAYSIFLSHTPCSNEGNEAEGRVEQLVCLDARIATGVICLTERKRGRGNSQKMYAYRYLSYYIVVVRELVICYILIQIARDCDGLHSTPVQFDTDCALQRKQALLRQERGAT